VNPNQVYISLQAYQRRHGYPPTLKELAERAGMCKASVLDALQYLVGQGVVEHLPRAPRAYWIDSEPHHRRFYRG